MESKAKRLRSIWFYSFALLLLSGCGGQLYRVAAPPKVAPPALPTDAQGLTMAARMLTSDELMEQFDANLLLAGVIVIDVRAANRGNVAKSVTLALRDDANTVFKPLLPKQALQQVMKFYGNLLYAKAAYQNTLEKYEQLACPFRLDLIEQAERRGFLYFSTKADATTLRGLQLITQGGALMTIKLN
jgi:hypothetical protein